MPKTGVTAAIAEMFEDNERLKRADELLRLELSRKFPRRYYLAKHLSKSNVFFYLKFVFGILVIEAYYSYNFSSVKDFASTTLV